MAALTEPRAIVALDVGSTADARDLLHRLGSGCDFVKVGSELFTGVGPDVIDVVRRAGFPTGATGSREVFLDLKLHDIPNTVRGAARQAAALGVRLLTAHATGGRAMLEAAVEGGGDMCGVLAVTVLTSLDAAELGAVWGRSIERVQDEVLRLAGVARAAGVHGVVCSGREASAVRAEYGETLRILVPGVRLAGGAAHDQRRIVTPEQAAAAGASYVVVGRAVTADPDPRLALERVRTELGYRP